MPEPRQDGPASPGKDVFLVARVSKRPRSGVSSLMAEAREVMNIRQASQYLGVSPDTLYRYICDGEVPAFKLGNRWKFKKATLDRWMERKMSRAPAVRKH